MKIWDAEAVEVKVAMVRAAGVKGVAVDRVATAFASFDPHFERAAYCIVFGDEIDT